jgi:hypothetical protein
MKQGRVIKNQYFDGNNSKEESEEWSKKADEKYQENDDKWMKRREKYPMLDEQGLENFTEIYYKKKNI